MLLRPRALAALAVLALVALVAIDHSRPVDGSSWSDIGQAPDAVITGLHTVIRAPVARPGMERRVLTTTSPATGLAVAAPLVVLLALVVVRSAAHVTIFGPPLRAPPFADLVGVPT